MQTILHAKPSKHTDLQSRLILSSNTRTVCSVFVFILLVGHLNPDMDHEYFVPHREEPSSAVVSSQAEASELSLDEQERYIQDIVSMRNMATRSQQESGAVAAAHSLHNDASLLLNSPSLPVTHVQASIKTSVCSIKHDRRVLS